MANHQYQKLKNSRYFERTATYLFTSELKSDKISTYYESNEEEE